MTRPEPQAPLLYRASTPEATSRLAGAIAVLGQEGDVIVLEGQLGAGKTHFARAFIRTLTGPETPVPSPTFALVQSYETSVTPVHHFDLYRLEGPEELEELGFWDFLDSGICLIEWADRGEEAVPRTGLEIRFHPDPENENARQIELVPGPVWQDRIPALKEALT